MAVMETFIRELKRGIASRSVTVMGLAGKCGCSKQHIYNIINGDREITLTLATKIAAELGKPIRMSNTRRKQTA